MLLPIFVYYLYFTQCYIVFSVFTCHTVLRKINVLLLLFATGGQQSSSQQLQQLQRSSNITKLLCQVKTFYLSLHFETLQRHVPTFGLTFLKRNSTTALGDQVPSTGEARGTAHLRLVHSKRTGQAGDEAITGVLTWGTLT